MLAVPPLNDDELIKKLTAEVLKVSRKSFGEKTYLLNDIPQRMNRRYSFMFRYHLQTENGEKIPILAKIPHQSWMTTIDEAVKSEQLRNEVQFEYSVMQSIVQVISNSRNPQLTAIYPLGCVDEWNAILTREINLKVLKDYLTTWPIILGSKPAWLEFTNILRLAGIWLKVVHDTFSTNAQTDLKSLNMLSLVQEELSLLEKKHIKSIPSLREKFVKTYDLIADKKIIMSSIHDDYHLGNIFVTPEFQVGAFDLNWKENRAIYEDLSKLLVDPPTRRLQVLCYGVTFRSSLRRNFENAVLNGYFDKSPIPYSIIWFYCALAVLEKWRNAEEMLEARQSLIIAFIRPAILFTIRRYFSKLVTKYLESAMYTT